MPKYSLKDIFPSITLDSVQDTFAKLSSMPLGHGMFAAHYSPIRSQVAEITKQGLPRNMGEAQERISRMPGVSDKDRLTNK